MHKELSTYEQRLGDFESKHPFFVEAEKGVDKIINMPQLAQKVGGSMEKATLTTDGQRLKALKDLKKITHQAAQDAGDESKAAEVMSQKHDFFTSWRKFLVGERGGKPLPRHGDDDDIPRRLRRI